MKFTDKQKIILCKTLLAEFAHAERSVFIQFCEAAGLDPFRKQVYAQARQGKLVTVTSIDGFRVIAQRSGEYQGQTQPMWMDGAGNWHEVWLHSRENPVACKVGVMRAGFAQPLYSIATMSEHGGIGPMWKKMPAHMLSIRAESLALRKAFPNELSGILTEEEIGNDPMPKAEQPKENASSRAQSIRDRLGDVLTSGTAIEDKTSEDVFQADDAEWLADALATVDSSLDSLRVAMSGGTDIDKSLIPLEPEGNWPLAWKGRIDKWLKMEAQAHEV